MFMTPARAAEPLFRFAGSQKDAFALLDLRGDAATRTVSDPSVPSGFGPEVLEIRGDLVLLFVPTVRMSAGTIVALWNDVAPRDADADGIILFGAKYPEDLSEAHNTKRLAAHVWFEQDTDTGLSVRAVDEKGHEAAVTERPGVGVTDEPWNRVGWFWQKVTFGDGTIRAKFWSVLDAEPQEWHLTTPAPFDLAGRIGVRASSARFRLAYYEASAEDITVARPDVYIDLGQAVMLEGQRLSSRITASPEVAKRTARASVRVRSPDGKQTKPHVVANPTAESNTFVVPIHDGAGSPRMLPALGPGSYEVEVTLTDGNGKRVAQCVRRFDVRSSGAIRERVGRIRSRIDAAKAAASARESRGLEHREVLLAALAAERLLALAERRMAAGELEAIDRPLRYAEEALDTVAGLIAAATKDTTGKEASK